jgi:hypothetical protein
VSTPRALTTHRRLARRLAATWALVGACLLAIPACRKAAYVVENRSSPVRVVVEAPAAAAVAQQVALRVTVGDRTVIDGQVLFPAGRTRVDLPTVHLGSGPRDVEVFIAGRPAARSTALVGHATWVRVTLTGGGGAAIAVFDRDPLGAR